MTKVPVFIIFLLSPLVLRGQEEICIGTAHVLHSSLLNEVRSYWVYLPDSYNLDQTKTFPVTYLLDGDSFFHSLAGMTKTLASGRNRSYSEMIIVGVLNTDRTRDLTPTASAAGRDGKVIPGNGTQGGGSETFLHFLCSELRSAIEDNYRTNGHNILIGHSYGGLFTLNTLFRHADLFDTYLAIDPSLWWDQGKLTKEAALIIKGKNFSGKCLYMGVATKKRTDRTDIHLDQINQLITEVLPQAENLHFVHKSFPEENHGTVVIPGMYDGIKQILYYKHTN